MMYIVKIRNGLFDSHTFMANTLNRLVIIGRWVARAVYSNR